MPTKLSNAAQRAWFRLGIGADLHGRLAFGVLAISSAVGGYTFMRERVGTISAIIVAVCVTLIMLSWWRLYVVLKRTLAEDATELSRQLARERDERKVLRQREARAFKTGTLVPPGYAAIISGQQTEPGEWVPPGFRVSMGPGQAADTHGTTVVGADARAYNARGATVMGSGATTGTKPY